MNEKQAGDEWQRGESIDKGRKRRGERNTTWSFGQGLD